MIIIHKIDDLLFDLFPKAKAFGKNIDVLLEELTDYYTYSVYKPKIKIEEGYIYIELDTDRALKEEKEYQEVVSLCEKGKFGEAKPILSRLLEGNPTNSEYYRILGQILSEEGNQTEAINNLIDAIKWDSRNGYAFIMLGNIYAKYLEDIETATKFYNKSLEVDTDNNIAINNIGGTLLSLGKYDEAEKYLELAYSIDKNYPNTKIGLAQINIQKGRLLHAFGFLIGALKGSKSDSPIYAYVFEMMLNLSKTYVEMKDYKYIYENYKKELEEECGKEIVIIQDKNIEGSAKIEIAEYYNRDRHILKFKEEKTGIIHLIMHELVHLDFVQRARHESNNYKFVSSKKNKESFLRDNESFIKKLSNQGLKDESIVDITNQLFKGMNLQFFNSPVDLYIEDYLYNYYRELRPFQFLSLFDMYYEYVQSIEQVNKSGIMPYQVVEVNSVLNLVAMHQFKELYGVDLASKVKSNNLIKKISKELYSNWEEKRYNKKGGDEYKMIEDWGKRLKIRNYFELLHEGEEITSVQSDLVDILKNIEKDPYNLNDPEAIAAENKKFHYDDSPAGSMAVTMYCLDALQTFKDKPSEYIRNVGIEIATLGRYGIDPDNHEKKYNLATIPDKTFTGLHLLTFMYVAFQHIDPSLNTGMEFESEYRMAKSMFNV